MAAKKGKATAGAAPEKQAQGEKQGETYKGWSAGKGGPIAFSDELRAEIDAFHDIDPTDNDEARGKLEARGLEYDDEERNYLETWNGDSCGWKSKSPPGGHVFTLEEAEEVEGMIATWLATDDQGAADLEAVLIARGLERPADHAERRARHAIEDQCGYVVISEHDTKKGKSVTLGYRAEKGTTKTLTLPTLVEVLAAVRKLEGKTADAAAPPAVPPQPAATSAPASSAAAASPAAPSATSTTSSPAGSAAGDAHAQSALNAQSATWSRHLELKEKVRAAEERASRRDATIAGLVAELEDEIAHICGVDEDDLEGSWLDDDVKMDGIHGLRAKLAEKRHTIRRLTGAADLEHAKEELAEFEKANPLFTQKAPAAPAAKPAVPEKPKDKLEAAVAAEAAKQTAPVEAKPKSEGATKLEALLSSPPPIQPADLTQETRKELADLGFKFTGKFSAPVPSRAQIEEKVVGYKMARDAKQKHRLKDLEDSFAAIGWVREEKAAPALVGASS